MPPFDPFGDRAERGHLRNVLGLTDPDKITIAECIHFSANLGAAIKALMQRPIVTYEDVKATHKRLFGMLYPWAGEDRSVNAPTIAIEKSGMTDLFAHPNDIKRAADYALQMGNDKTAMRNQPGEVMGYLAHAHPFLDGNGRTIMTVHAVLAASASFQIDWASIGKDAYLRALTDELRKPGSSLDRFLAPHISEIAPTEHQTARQLSSVPGFAGAGTQSKKDIDR